MYYNLAKQFLTYFDKYNKKKISNFFLKENNGRIRTLVDVGSHHGESIFFFKKNFSIDKIFAFEPGVENFKILKENTKGLENTQIFNTALGDKTGHINFQDHYDSESSTLVKINKKSNYYKKKNLYLNFFNTHKISSKGKKVEINTLNNLINIKKSEYIDLVKIDTEGYDFHVVKGLGKLINRVKYIYFEHHFHDMLIKGYKFNDIDAYLKKNNFCKVFKIKMFFRKTFEYIYKNNSINK